MAKNVIAQLSGGSKQVLDGVDTVRDVKAKLNATTGYTAAINGDSAEDNEELNDGDVVTLAKAVKGGSI
jgi:sulfur carrier protein ThiS